MDLKYGNVSDVEERSHQDFWKRRIAVGEEGGGQGEKETHRQMGVQMFT